MRNQQRLALLRKAGLAPIFQHWLPDRRIFSSSNRNSPAFARLQTWTPYPLVDAARQPGLWNARLQRRSRASAGSLPPSFGRYSRNKNFGLTDAGAAFIHSGKVTIYCPDSADLDGFYNKKSIQLIACGCTTPV